jgi:hypothetical protein
MGAKMKEPEGRDDPERRSFRAALCGLRRAYAQEDGGHVITAYEEAQRRSWTFGLLAAVLERVYPVRAFLRLAADLFDPAIGQEGLHAGCRRILNSLPFDWNAVLPSEGEERLRTAPVIFYGNHPSLLTPFLVAACVDREDLAFMSTSYVRRLIPSFRKYCLRLEVSLTRSWTEWRRGGLRRVLAYRLLSVLHAVPRPDEAKEINRRAIGDAVDFLQSGGSVMIIPGGGGKRDRDWFPGIGLIAKRLVENPGAEPVWVAPIREENCSNKRIYATLLSGPFARVRRRRNDRHPVCIRIAAPTRLTEVIGKTPSVTSAVAALRDHYRRAFS